MISPRLLLQMAVLLCFAALGLAGDALAGPNQVPKQPLPPGAVRGVVTRGAAMRTAHSRIAPVVHRVEKGLFIAVFGSQDGFYAVQLRNGRQGWVPVNAVRLASPLPLHSFAVR